MCKEIVVTTREIAKKFNVSEATICRWRKRGMPFIVMSNGRKGYNIKDIQKWLYNV